MPNAFVNELARDVFDSLEQLSSVIYTPLVGSQTTVNVAIRRGIRRVGFESRLDEQHDEVAFLIQDIATPKRGDTINDGSTTWEIISSIQDDDITGLWIMAEI